MLSFCLEFNKLKISFTFPLCYALSDNLLNLRSLQHEYNKKACNVCVFVCVSMFPNRCSFVYYTDFW